MAQQRKTGLGRGLSALLTNQEDERREQTVRPVQEERAQRPDMGSVNPIRIDQIDRRRRNLVVQREGGEYRFDAACATEQVPRHRLGRVDDDAVRALAERRDQLIADWLT